MTLFDLYPEASLDDLSMYFMNSSILLGGRWFHVKGIGIFAVEDDPNGPDQAITGYYQDSKKGMTVRLKDADVEVVFPESGYYRHRGTAILFNRRNMRQACKGLCSKTVMISQPFSEFLKPLYQKGQTFKITQPFELSDDGDFSTSSVVIEAMGAVDGFASLPEAAANVQRENTLSLPLSRRFALSKGIYSQYPSIWFREVPIGEALSATTVKIASDLFKQEAYDFFNPQGITVY